MKKTANSKQANKTTLTAKLLGQRTGRRLASPSTPRKSQILTCSAPSGQAIEQEGVSMHAITTDGVAEQNPICLRKMVLEARYREGERILHAAKFEEILTETMNKIEFAIAGMPPASSVATKVRDIIYRARKLSQEV